MYDTIVEKILESLRVLSINDLPMIKWEQSSSHRFQLTIWLLCRHRKNVSKFFYDMISRWLIPGKHLDVSLYFTKNFQKEDILFTVCELSLILENAHDLILAKRNFPFLEKEILLGVNSFYHATKILEMKGLTLDEKTSLIQEKIAAFVSRFPKVFDYDIFGEMQHVLITSKEEFKAVRQPSELSRLIMTLYHFRKGLEQEVAKAPLKRHLCLKIKKTLLHTPFGFKEVLSIFLGLSFLKEHELFEERHFILALSRFIAGIQSIPNSYYVYEGGDEQIQTCYLEVEKENQRPFSLEELNQLKQGLIGEIQGRIEQLVPPVFMPRNEEEVMRNILILSQQIRYLRDIPQMIISFDEQTDTELSFTVILVRILHPDSPSIQELFENSYFADNLLMDRVKLVGRLRRKYPKEAAVIRVRFPSEGFLREDFSVDLFHARLHLVKEIEKIIGEVRDYNGGMIAKQSENYLHLKKIMGKVALKHTLLLQNFFHSIFPVHLSTTLDPLVLKILFQLLLESIRNPKTMAFKSKKANDYLFVMTKFQDFSWKQKIFNRIESLKLSSNELLTVQIQIFDSLYLGFIYLNPEKSKQMVFLDSIPEALCCEIQNTLQSGTT